MSRKRLVLIDGMSHIYRAYYAIPKLSNSKGFPTNAVYGFTSMLRKLIDDEEPDYIGVAFDLEGPTVRHEKFEAYKATRKPMPEDSGCPASLHPQGLRGLSRAGHLPAGL